MTEKGTVFVVDHASEKFCEAIHKAGFKAGALVLWHDRVTPGKWAIDAAGYDIQIRMDLKKDSLDDIEAAVRQAAPKVAGIIPTNEPSEEAACRLAARFNVPHNDPEIAKIRWHKGRVKDLAAAAGLRVPKYQECRTEADIMQAAKEFDFPVIIKTPAGSAGVNVFKCHNFQDLLEKHLTIVTTPDDFGNQPDYSLVEEYISGTEYHVSTFTNGRRTIVSDVWEVNTVDTQFATNIFYDARLINPSDPKVTSVVSSAEKFATTVGITLGPGYLQLKADDKGPALIEAHARFGGGSIPEIVRYYSNLDTFISAVEVYAKGSTVLPRRMRYSAHFAIVACPSIWQFKRARCVGIEEIRRLPSFYSSKLRFNSDTYAVQPTTNLHNIPLIVWLHGVDLKQIKEDMTHVHNLFQVEAL